jgi:hypothetical protein
MKEYWCWNSIADRPPVPGKRCLVYMPKKDRDNPEVMTVATFTPIAGWWPVSPERQGDITHWMESPSPPDAPPP